MEKQRKKSILVITILGLIAIVAGTFAWSSFSQEMLNQQDVLSTGAGGRIHDDYNIEEGNKDIYAENYGAQPLLVRLKLSEYMEMNGTSLVDGAIKDDFTTWTTYTMPENSVSDPFRDYVTWTMGGKKNYLPTFNTNRDSTVSDAAGDAIDLETGKVTHPGKGLQTDFELNESYENLEGDASHEAKTTLTQSRAPISMADWKLLDDEAKKGDFWVIDTDGWAYWANSLESGKATSLLLDGLTWDKEHTDTINGKGYYGIHVTGQFTTGDETDKFFEEPESGTDDAKGFIDQIKGVTYEVEVSGNTEIAFEESGVTETYTASVNKIDPLAGTNTPVTNPELIWTVASATGDTSIDENGVLSIATNETSEILNISAQLNGVPSAIGTLDVNIVYPLVLPADPLEGFRPFPGLEDEVFIDLKDFGDGNHLVLRKDVLEDVTVAYCTYGVNPPVTPASYAGYDLDKKMKAYSTDLMNRSDKAKEMIQPVQKTFSTGAFGAHPYDTNFFSPDLLNVLTSRDDIARVTEGGEQKAFALSVDEVSEASGSGEAFRSVNDRTISGDKAWWLRTPCDASNYTYYAWNIVHSTGRFDRQSDSNLYAVRPAMILYLGEDVIQEK